MSNKRICDVCGSTITSPYIKTHHVSRMLSSEKWCRETKDICGDCWIEFTKFIKNKREVEQ